MIPTLGRLGIALLLLTLVFGVMERRFPARRRRSWRGSGVATDVAYWFFTPMVTRPLRRLFLALPILILGASLDVPLEREALGAFFSRARGPVAVLPVGLQLAIMLVLGDLVAYGMHRLFHRGRLWPFHAVHHASRELDWLSSVRLHPVNDVVTRLAQAVPLLLLGFAPGLVALYLPFLSLYALLLHANVPWSFGPLRFVVASPAFHRWHHTSEREGRDTNFAGLFPFIDVAFGTFFLPDRQPAMFGVDDRVPEGILAQLAYPFMPPKGGGAAAADAGAGGVATAGAAG